MEDLTVKSHHNNTQQNIDRLSFAFSFFFVQN